ncbi:MAG: hypothetical protein AUJ82_05080 [Verrucomicrobia bacterium CG1_02_43_26]|nr:MAG: hypothetical protein AUJ82_05080 [Verrucomicrobia bacterium CG1_02_43_26]
MIFERELSACRNIFLAVREDHFLVENLYRFTTQDAHVVISDTSYFLGNITIYNFRGYTYLDFSLTNQLICALTKSLGKTGICHNITEVTIFCENPVW